MTEWPDRRKSGSAMTDKEMARAAIDQRLVTFYAMHARPVEGFVVAMDDYHWKVAVPALVALEFRAPISMVTVLVHKSCPLVVLSPATLEDQEEPVRDWVNEIGSAFRSYCSRTYFGRELSFPTPRMPKEQQ